MKIDEYKYAEDLVMMVIKGYNPSALLISEGGLGKSYLVKTLCNKHCPDSHHYHSGHITPLALYQKIFDKRDKIIILDDVEALFKYDNAVSILRSALWEVDRKRIVSWASTSDKLGDYPQSFEFTGGIILLCNYVPNKFMATIKAFKTRTLKHTIFLSYKQKLAIMKEMIDKESFDVKLSKEDRERLKSDLEKHTSLVTENFNFRTMEKLVKFYAYGKKYHPNEPNRHIELHNATNSVDEDKVVILELMKKKFSVLQQVQQFIKRTGKSRATYFRIKKELMKEIK